jgi:hypothetical protein
MPRTRISRDLGPLPRGSVLGGVHGKTDTLLQILRPLALKNQRERPRVFYSLREVAKQFRVPISTVAKTYHDLEREGLLTRVRGSKTILNGRRYNRRLSIRAFVGLAALVPNYVALPEYRGFFVTLRQELWLRGFAATTVFFHPDESASEKLSERLKTLGVDTVIWLHPGRTAKQTFLRLADLGVQTIGISAIGTPSFPLRYHVWRENAIETLLRDLTKQGDPRPLTILESPAFRSPVTEDIVRLMCLNAQLSTAINRYSGEDIRNFLKALSQARTKAIIFPASGLVAMLACRCPDELGKLCETQRVAFIDGPFNMPFAKIPDTLVDLVATNWQPIAEAIVNDLITRSAFDQNRDTTFHAEAHLRVPISSFCDEINLPRSIGAPL